MKQKLQRFFDARNKSSQRFEVVKQKALETFGEEKEAIFRGHIMLLEDMKSWRDFSTHQERKMHADNAIHAIEEQKLGLRLNPLDDEYLKERATDIRDIGTRFVKML